MDAAHTSFSVVLVMHDSASHLPAFFATWQGTAGAAGISVPVVAADSGSEDSSAQVAAEFGARVIVLGNAGFGVAANEAIRQTASDWILLCNADLTFSGEFAAGVLRVMVSVPGDVAVIAPRVLNVDGTGQASVGRFPTVGSVVRDQFRRRDLRKYVVPQPAEACEIEWATGACLLLRRAWFEKVGGFDENYFLYVEEVDLQRRLRDAGGRALFVPELRVTHHAPNAVRQAREDVQQYAARGILRYFAKFGSWGALLACRKMVFLSGRLPWSEAFASREAILRRATGP